MKQVLKTYGYAIAEPQRTRMGFGSVTPAWRQIKAYAGTKPFSCREAVLCRDKPF
jgi:hypothetical protein